MDNELDYIIARNRDIDINVVGQQRTVSTNKAIERYFSKEVREQLIQEGKYFPDSKTRDEKLRNVGLSLSIGKYQEEFYKTPEGKLWFDCNVPTRKDVAMLCARISDDTRKYAESIRKGQQRALNKRRVRRPRFVG